MLFFKQKTAYEMRISDWSSYVCSSDLDPEQATPAPKARRNFTDIESRMMKDHASNTFVQGYNAQLGVDAQAQIIVAATVEIGRASCRGRVCKDVKNSGVAVALRKKEITSKTSRLQSR